MAKSNKARKSKEENVILAQNSDSNLREDRQLWYRICVLLYDLQNLSKDHNSEKRIGSTTDELYISAPYFTPIEAARIKATSVDNESYTIEDAIKLSLVNFFEKRRASGDSRPCGPHDLAPIYLRVFGLEQAEIQDERFLSRLRRSGLGA
jgi:hypothetical protein